MIRLRLGGYRFMNMLMMLGALGDYSTVNIIKNILVIMMALVGIAIIVVVLMQKGTNDNIGTLSGDSETYMGKNKTQNKDKKLKIATWVLGAVIVVLSIVYFVLNVL